MSISSDFLFFFLAVMYYLYIFSFCLPIAVFLFTNKRVHYYLLISVLIKQASKEERKTTSS